MINFFIALLTLSLVALACNGTTPSIPPTPENSIFASGKTAYGFFPVPPEPLLESALQHFKDMGQHGDFVLIQQNTPWKEFVIGAEGESQTRTDLINQVKLANQNNLETMFVIDPLNGLNRREFIGLPTDWEANFANPNIRNAHRNYALWIIHTFHPRYLGIASEINTYMDAHPNDAKNFISLYNEIYALVKAEAPETKVFVTFQWDDLNNMFPQPEEGNPQKFDTNWEQVEAFEPNLDIWVISTYPYFVFNSGTPIPADYYTPLLTRTSKPLAIAESGFSSEDVGPLKATPEDQLAFLVAIHDQLGPRLVFWVNLLLTDFNLEAMSDYMLANGQSTDNITSLGYFGHTGFLTSNRTPKPAMEMWDSLRDGR